MAPFVGSLSRESTVESEYLHIRIMETYLIMLRL
jgi:hypothetical protein